MTTDLTYSDADINFSPEALDPFGFKHWAIRELHVAQSRTASQQQCMRA
jgi:hypothetical protein